MNSLTDCFVLSNGVKIPCVGYGSWRTPKGEVCVNGVLTALKCGYRHLDTASVYDNEESIGEGVKQSGIPRSEIFITSKLWNTEQGYDNALAACDASLKRLATDYLDLYLIHWPNPKPLREQYPEPMLESWRALETLYRSGKVRAIGVSNFLDTHLGVLLANCTIKPMVNQLELHVGYHQQKSVDFARENGLAIEAWSPICKGRAMDDLTVKSVASKHGKTCAQVLIRWCMEKGYIPLPKSVTPSRIAENTGVFDFSLDNIDMAALDAATPVGRLGSYPDTAEF